MADRKDTREKEEKKDEAPAATPPAPPAAAPAAVPTPTPVPVHAAPPPKADGKTRAVTVAIWGFLAWVFLRLVPQQKIPGVLKGFGSMLWEAGALGFRTALETVAAGNRWMKKHGRRAFWFSMNAMLIAAILFVLGNEYGKRGPIFAVLAILIPMCIFWWFVIKALTALIYEATQAIGGTLTVFGRTMAALLRKAGVVIPDADADVKSKEGYFRAIEKYLEKIFLAMAAGLLFVFVDAMKPGWETVARMMPVAFLVVIIGFFNAHLKIESDKEVRVVRWGLRLLLWFSAAAVILPYSASVLAGKDFDKTVGDWLKQPSIGSVGIIGLAIAAITWLWLRLAMTPKLVRLADGSVWDNPRILRRKALAVTGSILIPLAVIFLFWRGVVTVAELKGEEAKTGTVEKAAKTEPPAAKAAGDVPKPKEETPKAPAPNTGTIGMTAPTGGAPPRLDLPDPVRSGKPDGMPKPYQPQTARTSEGTTPPPTTRRTTRDTKPRRYSNFLEADDALKAAGL